MSTLKFQKRMGGCAAIKELFHHCLTARKEVCYSASFAVTPALQLFHQDNRAWAAGWGWAQGRKREGGVVWRWSRP